MIKQLCPCGSNQLFQECCSVFIEHKQIPETALQLMRSRFTAYINHDLDYLLNTWHHSTRPTDMIQNDLQLTKWKQLYIVETTLGLAQDKCGRVEFVAYFKNNESYEKLHEVSDFVKDQNKWFYVNGKIINNSNFQPGRNSFCYCGSGKKFKKCCLIK